MIKMRKRIGFELALDWNWDLGGSKNNSNEINLN